MDALGKWLIRNLPFVADEHDALQGQIGKLKVELELSKERRRLADANFAATLLREVELQDKLAAAIVELEATKRKIVATPPEQPILKAKTAAEARRLAEQAFAREEEEAVNG